MPFPMLLEGLDNIESTDLGESDENGFFFSYEAGEFKTSMKCDMDSGTSEVCENLISFLYSCGFSLKSVLESFHQTAINIDKAEFDGKLFAEKE